MDIASIRSIKNFFLLYSSLSVFLFSALALNIPSGYSYGSGLLLLGSFSLIFKREKIKVDKYEWFIIIALVAYAGIIIFSNWSHSYGGRSYDRPLKYLLVIPVYFFLITYPPSYYSLWSGLVVGCIGAGATSIYQRYFTDGDLWRVGGFIHPIQFGDISILMAALLLARFVRFNKIQTSKDKIFLFLVVIAICMGVLASFQSESRGGWLIIPMVTILCFKFFDTHKARKVILSSSCIFILFLIGLVYSPNSNFIKDRLIETKNEIEGYINNEGKITSFRLRLKMWQNGIDAFRERPLFGWGDLGVIKESFPLQWAEINKKDNFSHLHNEYIDELAKRGLIGLTGLLSLYLISTRYFWSKLKAEQVEIIPFAVAGVILMLGVMIFGLTQVFLAHNSGVMIFLFYLIILLSYCKKSCR